MNIRLSHIANIHSGHPFRGAITPAPDGSTYVVQARNMTLQGETLIDNLITTHLTGKKQPDCLRQGDILFLAKGARHFAACMPQLPEQTVCSPDFFVIKLKGATLPEFISWQLNQVPAQRYFLNSAEGTFTVSIRRKVLEDTPLTLPPLEKQQQIVNLYKTAMQEQKTLQQLISNRQQQLEAIALEILSK